MGFGLESTQIMTINLNGFQKEMNDERLKGEEGQSTLMKDSNRRYFTGLPRTQSYPPRNYGFTAYRSM